MSITMYLRCNSCHKDFKTTVQEAIPLKDLPEMCMTCWDNEVAEEIKEREVSMKFREATKNDNWYWDGDSISYSSIYDDNEDGIYDVDEDTLTLPLLTSGEPIIAKEPEPEAIDPLPEGLAIRVDSLIAALRSNRAY